ncbi:MAG: bifunctional hydroxymethylpyrimidine kinase/phosphomethylpyrimidine kinase [Oscillospiraceae bacterium]|nr:bifunctional hydroxymethylpyrimidine kinase/phosphomethylpyrimidine kinase [Oscillospiraceae bacterium]
MKAALSIAGSDSSGGAGIQADLKTMTLHGVYAMSAVTALTAQNTAGVRAVAEVTPEFLRQQLDAVFEDIPPDAVKIGMVPSAGLIQAAAERLRFYGAERVVVDPVMVSTSGARLMDPEAVETLKRRLFPLARLITPNLPEAEVLAGMPIRSREDMAAAARRVGEEWGCAVLCKGGHSGGGADDVLYDGGTLRWFHADRVPTGNTHGTGCTLSSAIAANLARGLSLERAVGRAKEYLSGSLRAGLNLGAGSGPLHHAFEFYTIEGERII